MQARPLFAIFCGLGAAAFTSACLPSDDRPPPGSVTFTVSPSEAVVNGVVTADGWTLSFDRILLGIGRTELQDGCTAYAEPRYDRLLDVAKASNQKLSIIYGLGSCCAEFRVAPPSQDVLLGVGVTSADRAFMQNVGQDAYAESGTAVWVEGSATRSAVAIHFGWAFRRRIFSLACSYFTDDGKVKPLIDLKQHEDDVEDITIRGEALFSDRDWPFGRLRFEPFHEADAVYGNGDGDVSLDELSLVPLTAAAESARGNDAGSSGGVSVSLCGADAAPDAAPYSVGDAWPILLRDGAVSQVTTLRDYVYGVLQNWIPEFTRQVDCTAGTPTPR